ncbi:hypothetical protein [Pantoea phytobeneficialis]|uniref:Uncharacterized protein n=1 Tax=Pantoea phytobeneficialis TaxID=2052056 RepID=A0AAP9HAB3_9GAMM|nr:hypothetical protein [Pantoea phytobeneficialis]MDO6407530.1 hypothetical protein [Pantoea phytobeneficialis]QGR09424.1 hypothetical protein CTZ24_23400 [Pantoea phytobeneficialis]
MKKVTFSARPNPAGVTKAILSVMAAEGWELLDAQHAAEPGEIGQLDDVTAERLRKAIEDAAGDKVKIEEE